jgi:hypothetical protein
VTEIKPGQVWKDKRVGRPPFDDFRRLATVKRTDDRYVYVEGRYEQREDGVWRPAGWPNGIRHSRVLLGGFVATHELIQEARAEQ